MEDIIYEDSPLAEYLEGECSSFETPSRCCAGRWLGEGIRNEVASRSPTVMVPLHTHNPSIYASTAATVVRLLTKRLGAGKAEVDWEEASYSDEEGSGKHQNGDVNPTNSDFAPRGPPKTGKSFKGILPPPLKVKISKEGGVEGLLNVFAVR